MVQLACKYKMASLVEPAFNVGDPGLIPGLGRLPGEGNGYPIQYSGPQNSMDRGAWQATAHGFAKSLTQLNTLTSEKKKDPICANAKSFNPKY